MLTSTGLPSAVPSRLDLSGQSVSSPTIDAAQAAESLYHQAESLVTNGQYRLARINLFEAVQLWQQANLKERAASVLEDAGQRHNQSDRWQDALLCYRWLLQLPGLRPRTRMTAYTCVGDLYLKLNLLDLAEGYYQPALRLARQMNDPLAQARAMTGLATVLAQRGQREPARRHLEQARRWARRAGDESAEAATLHSMSQLYRDQGKLVEAHTTLQQALALDQQSGDQYQAGQTLCHLSGVCLARGQSQAAFEWAIQAQALTRQLQAGDLKWRTRLALARAQRALGRDHEARQSYFQAFGLMESWLLYLSADALQIAFLAERQAVYRELVELLIEQGQTDEAFQIMEHARARATLDSLAEARRRGEQPDAVGQPGELREIAERMNWLRTEARAPQRNDQQRAALQVELTGVERRLEELRLATGMNRLKRFTTPATLRQVQEKLLRPGDVLLEFFLGERRSYVWFISSHQTKCAALLGQKEIEEAIKSYLEMISVKPSGLYLEQAIAKQTKAARRLFDLLLGPLAAHLKPDQRLIIVPDGLLNNLPFETLIRDGRSLIEDHEISYVPSASALGLLQQANNSEGAADRLELLAVGDPAFRSPLEVEVGKNQRPDADNLIRELWLASGYRWPPLANARTEVQAISEFFPPERQQTYLGQRATEEAIKRELQRRYRRLHFATHSLIDERFPARSGVVLTLDDDPAEDGVLDVNEIAELKLDCDLVVLSACQTGRGRLFSGEGTVGLARAFLVAGGRSVAVSLWSVSDLSTAQFMKDFYRHLAAGLEPAAALRQTKLDRLRSTTARRHPYYWAAFVLVGKAGGQSMVSVPATSGGR
jgi:CHAT domain-containing protein